MTPSDTIKPGVIHSGKHRNFAANLQAIARPDGLPAWTCQDAGNGPTAEVGLMAM
jgi:hypothetical protein